MTAPLDTDTQTIENVKVRVLPDGRMDRRNAALYLGVSPKTLATWAWQSKGPPSHQVGGRVFYLKRELDRFIGGENAA